MHGGFLAPLPCSVGEKEVMRTTVFFPFSYPLSPHRKSSISPHLPPITSQALGPTLTCSLSIKL